MENLPEKYDFNKTECKFPLLEMWNNEDVVVQEISLEHSLMTRTVRYNSNDNTFTYPHLLIHDNKKYFTLTFDEFCDQVVKFKNKLYIIQQINYVCNDVFYSSFAVKFFNFINNKDLIPSFMMGITGWSDMQHHIIAKKALVDKLTKIEKSQAQQLSELNYSDRSKILLAIKILNKRIYQSELFISYIENNTDGTIESKKQLVDSMEATIIKNREILFLACEQKLFNDVLYSLTSPKKITDFLKKPFLN